MSTSPVTYVSTDELLSRLGGSVDIADYSVCWCSNPCGCEHAATNWQNLWSAKYGECTEEFKAEIVFNFSVPVCVWIPGDKGDDVPPWVMGNGHHRVSIAREHGLAMVPVVFAFDGDYMHEESTTDPEKPAEYGDFTYYPDEW